MKNRYFIRALHNGLISIPLLLLLAGCQNTPVQVVEEVKEVLKPEPIRYYGIEIDSLELVKGKVKWNQTLSDILSPFNVTGEQLYEISKKSKSVYDVRYIKAGSSYSILHRQDSLQTVRAYIFEPDPRSFVVYHFGDSIYAELVAKEVSLREKSIACEIKTSVYEAALDAGASPLLVSKLVDIFAWQVDFFRIQQGDKFKVIYEEEVVDGEAVGISRIIGVYFEHFQKSYYGIFYDAEGKEDYFDEDGNSLRKTFLRAPLNYRRISSRFTYRRLHPVQKTYKAHLGTDYAADPGTPIRTVGDGIVEEAGFGQYNGNYVKIKHNSNYSTQYLHMQKIKTGIRPGVMVKQGETIGFVGSTGLARGPHLCFRFWKNGRQVDALAVDLPPSEPIKASELTSFLHQKNNIIYKLDLISFNQAGPANSGKSAQP